MKPCHDADLPLWLRRKRHEILAPVVTTSEDLSDDEKPISEDIHDLGPLYDMDIDLDATIMPYMTDNGIDGGSYIV